MKRPSVLFPLDVPGPALPATHIIKSTGEAGQQPKDSEGDAEGGPQAELPLELGFVAQGSEGLFIGRVFGLVNGEVARWEDGGDLLLDCR